jgi:hypothetical protein
MNIQTAETKYLRSKKGKIRTDKIKNEVKERAKSQRL